MCNWTVYAYIHANALIQAKLIALSCICSVIQPYQLTVILIQ